MSQRNLERVLSIQSHVAYGYVGGKAAVFPLQLLGFDVDVVNTVNFSNHSGYGRSGGTRSSAADLTGIFDAMEQNGFLKPTRLLTGYIPGAEGLSSVANLSSKLCERTPDLIYLLDPVIGDAGKLYVAADVIPVYRSMLHRATIITPNWFEVEVLTDVKIEDQTSLQKALTILHTTYSVPNVVISSIPLKPWLLDLLPDIIRPTSTSIPDSPTFLLCIASCKDVHSSTSTLSTVYANTVPVIPGYFSGVGDLFSALVLAHYNPSTPPAARLAHAVSLALTKTHAILQRTYEYACTLPEVDRQPTDEELDAKDPTRRIRRMGGRELRLIQGQAILRGETTAMGDVRRVLEWEKFW
ncbi:Ribokinase-like protein [Amylostereum chailletii]|nr:Ribokinase-like protein [Amylostereum chailletii]